MKVCASFTGTERPRVVTYDCDPGETCQTTVSGDAKCVLTAACQAGTSTCSGNELKTCSNGTYVTQTCSNGCDPSPLGAFCVPNGTFTTFSGRVRYEGKRPNSDLSDWSPTPVVFNGIGFLVLSMNTNGTVYDATYSSGATGQEGTFTVRVPQSPTVNDGIFIVAAGDDGAGGLAFAVADPGFSVTGQKTVGVTPESPRVWMWSGRVANLTPGQDLTISIAAGSPAARVHQNLLAAYAYTYTRYNRVGKPIVVWLGPEITWSCGKCFASVPTFQFGTPFSTQMWLAGDSENEPYWSDAVTEHEFGHWTMDTYGRSPGEGGTHVVGNPTFPGQAWSEGFATWFSSDLRRSSIYLDKQGGAMFWLDLTQHAYGSGPFPRPSATNAAGVLQNIDENEVAGMLLNLSTSSSSASQSVFTALASSAMTVPPYGRGYTRHTWDLVPGPAFKNVVDTGEPKPTFADLLDSLNCAGFPRASIDLATQPTTYFPYPSNSPICR